MDRNQRLQTVSSITVMLSLAFVCGADESRREPEGGRSETEQAGVGLALGRQGKQLVVTLVLPDSPAARSNKIHKNDRLIAVGQGSQLPVNVEGMPIEKVVAMIRGIKGSVVILTIVPSGKTSTDAVAVPLTRGTIKELNRFGDGHYIPVGEEAPNFSAVRLTNGQQYQLTNSRGKVVVLEFWARWCSPCLKGIDQLQAWREQHREWKDRVQLIAVAVDDEVKDAAESVQQKGRGWPDIDVVWAGPEVLKSFHIDGLPTVYLLDEAGRVIAVDHRLDLPTLIKKR